MRFEVFNEFGTSVGNFPAIDLKESGALVCFERTPVGQRWSMVFAPGHWSRVLVHER